MSIRTLIPFLKENARFIVACDVDGLEQKRPVSPEIAMTIVVEGVSFLWAHRNVTGAYVQWRLGTLYGSFTPSGADRPMRELLRELWRDRRGVVDYLLWRRTMRRKKAS